MSPTARAQAIEALQAQIKELRAEGLEEEARFPGAVLSAIRVLEEEGIEGVNGEGEAVGADWVVEKLGDCGVESCRALIEEWRILLAVAHTVSPYTTPRTRNGTRKPAGRVSFLEVVGRRDDWSCIVSGLGHLHLALDFLPPDEVKTWKASRRARPRLVGHCKVGHIFPFASVDRPDYPRFLEHLTGIKVGFATATSIDDPRNGMVLDGSLNALFGTLDLAFKATEKENDYEIVYSSAWGGPGYPTHCTFTTTTDIPLPDPSILRIYYILFRVLHSSEDAAGLLHPAIDYDPLEELSTLPHKGTGGEAVLGIALLKQILSSEAEKRASEFAREV